VVDPLICGWMALAVVGKFVENVKPVT